MSRSHTAKKAIIIGGGVGGLCAAIALKQRGIAATVYEQAEMLGDVGAGLVLWANAVQALRELGLAEAVIQSGAVIQHGQICTSDGKILARTEPGDSEKTFGAPTVAIHRAALHKALLSALPDANVQLGAACVGIEQDANGVTARFAGASAAHGDLLIGADGIRSVVRRQLFPQIQLRYSGYTAWCGAVLTRDQAALGVTSESWGRGNRFGIVRMDAGRIYWFATANTRPGVACAVEEQKKLLPSFWRVASSHSAAGRVHARASDFAQ